MTTLAFFAPGIPQPQGSKTGFVRNGRAVLVEGKSAKARQAFADWRTSIRHAASLARGEHTIEGPVAVEVLFTLPAPASLPKRSVRLHTTRPDLDKLARACLDAMTQASVFKDDSQVVTLRVAKGYPLVDGRVGAWVTVNEVDPVEWRQAFVAKVERLAA